MISDIAELLEDSKAKRRTALDRIFVLSIAILAAVALGKGFLRLTWPLSLAAVALAIAALSHILGLALSAWIDLTLGHHGEASLRAAHRLMVALPELLTSLAFAFAVICLAVSAAAGLY
jgi:hypothetical protein